MRARAVAASSWSFLTCSINFLIFAFMPTVLLGESYKKEQCREQADLHKPFFLCLFCFSNIFSFKLFLSLMPMVFFEGCFQEPHWRDLLGTRVHLN